jgi:NAD(P)-dependent dehydrogenase (short-subunit alcohol dehydrogenase family)
MSTEGKYDSPLKATLKGIRDLYGKKINDVTLPDPVDLSGKTIMITGASSGLGFATAKRVAAAGARVIMVSRSGIPEKGEEIVKSTGNQNVTMYHVDLLDFESINAFLNSIANDGVTLDILISNAAMVPLKSRQTLQGLEEMFMVNYLAPFYLINQLIIGNIINDKIIIVSSESHRGPKEFEWGKFGKYHHYGMSETVSRYGYFKLLLTTFGNELSRRLNNRQTNIPVRMLCPGPVNSNIAREAPGWLQPLLRGVFSLFFRSPEKASDPIIYFAVESSDQEKPTDYLFLMNRKPMDDKATDVSNGEKLWKLSEELIQRLGYSVSTIRSARGGEYL